MTIAIEHDLLHNRFVTTVDGHECCVEYGHDKHDARSITIFRTFVHPDLRGKGIAEALLKTISEYAAHNNLAIRPSCSYAVLYYRRHPDYAPLLAKDIDPDNEGSCRLK